MFCPKCGERLGEASVYCPSCGAKIERAGNTGENWQEKAQGYARAGANAFEAFTDTPDDTGYYPEADIEHGKGMSILSYLGFLVFIPLFAAKDQPYVRYHANQGLCLFLVELAWTFITRVLVAVVDIISWRLGNLVEVIMGLGGIVFFIMAIIGIMNVIKGRAKELPVIGRFRLIK